jgi:hypothetical protein
VAGKATDDDWQAITPFSYGRWDEAAQAHRAAEDEQRNMEVVAAFGAEGAFDPEATRTALAMFGQPVLLLAGEVDLAAPSSHDGRVHRAVSERRARRPARSRALPVARRRRPVRGDHRSVPGVNGHGRKHGGWYSNGLHVLRKGDDAIVLPRVGNGEAPLLQARGPSTSWD